MNNTTLKEMANHSLGNLLRAARDQTHKGVRAVASDLEISEYEIQRIENTPAEVPCRELFRLISYYGPSALHEAQGILNELQVRNFKVMQ